MRIIVGAFLLAVLYLAKYLLTIEYNVDYKV